MERFSKNAGQQALDKRPASELQHHSDDESRAPKRHRGDDEGYYMSSNSSAGSSRTTSRTSHEPLIPWARPDEARGTEWRGRHDETHSVFSATSDNQIEGLAEVIAPQANLFANAQGFSMQNTQFNTTILPQYPQFQLPDLLLDHILAHSAPSAAYNSKHRSHDTPKCDEDTRVGLLEEIMDWAQGEEVPSKLLCMTGSAGSGKSALSQTISETCAKKGCLGATFFFSVADPLRNNPDRFVASLAYQISQSLEGVKPNISRAVAKDPAVFEMSMETQAEVLLINPVLKAALSSKSKRPMVIVIDGLDECKGEENQAQVLRVLHSCVEREMPFRIFITSRPEYAMRSALAPSGHLNGLYHIILNEHDATEDIRLYLRRRLREIGRAKGDNNWPSEDLLEILVEGASGQFIYAATVFKFVGDRRRSRTRSLQTVIDWIRNSRGKRRQNPFAALDDLYTNILSTAQAAYEESFEDEGECPRLVHRLMTLMLLNDLHIIEGQDPVDSRAVEHFLAWDDDECDRIAEDLHSVVQVKETTDSPSQKHISFYHKSFLDYLLDSSRCQSFYMSPDAIFADLTIKALNCINTAELKPLVPYTQMVFEQELSMDALDRANILAGSQITALLAWHHFLPLALMVNPTDPVHDEICEAVVRLSEGGWNKLAKFEKAGIKLARASKGFQLLRCIGTSRDCSHSTLALCKSLPRPFTLDIRSDPVVIDSHPALFYPLRDQLEQSLSNPEVLHRVEPDS